MKRKICPSLIFALAVMFFAVCLLAACSGSSGKPKENCEESHDDCNTHQVRICTDKRVYDYGAPIYITFTVTNISDQPLTLSGGDELAMDIRVEGEYWSDGQDLTPELTRVTLEPGESRAITWVWPVSSPPPFKPMGEVPRMSISVFGIVKPFPGTDRAVWVFCDYRKP